jgi:alkyldihydroxyacetonephosphate synthase
MSETVERGPGVPTPPIPLAGDPESVTGRLGADVVAVPESVVSRLVDVCAEVRTDAASRAEASRDWWPLAMTWARDGQVGGLAGVVARPASPAEVAAVLGVCHEATVPVTAAAGRSGVVGGSVPVHGGVVLDLTGLAGIRDVDDSSLVVDVLAGTFGDRFEAELRADHGLTVGHWPQSMTLSTVGGWLACRGAGQLSNRYGKIEDMVVGLDVVLADGTAITTGGHARQAVGPDLDQVFVGSEGTLGVITGARLRAHPAPSHERRAAYGFASFADGLDACRRILRRGATPAVLRLYDAVEGERNFETGDLHPLLVIDEGDQVLVEAVMEVVAEECDTALRLDDALVERWYGHRNDVSALEALISRDYVVDTMEITGSWGTLPDIYHATVEAMGAVEGVLAASAHQSHAYTDGACLYFTFAGKPDPSPAAKDAFYRAVWDAGTRAVLARGGSLSHHHGVGLNRARFVADALGGGLDVLVALKRALDPKGILNPGKLGLPSPFGANPFAGPGSGGSGSGGSGDGPR